MNAGGGAEAASENADPSPAGAGEKRNRRPQQASNQAVRNRRPKPRRDKDAPRQTAKEEPTGQSHAKRPRAGRGPTKAGARRENDAPPRPARRPEKTRGGGAESKAESSKDATRDREEPSEDSRRSRQTPQIQARHRAQSQSRDKAGRRRKESHDPTEPEQREKRDGSNPRGAEQTRFERPATQRRRAKEARKARRPMAEPRPTRKHRSDTGETFSPGHRHLVDRGGPQARRRTRLTGAACSLMRLVRFGLGVSVVGTRVRVLRSIMCFGSAQLTIAFGTVAPPAPGLAGPSLSVLCRSASTVSRSWAPFGRRMS